MRRATRVADRAAARSLTVGASNAAVDVQAPHRKASQAESMRFFDDLPLEIQDSWIEVAYC